MEVGRARDTYGMDSLKLECARAEVTYREAFRQAFGMLAVCEWGGLSSVVLRGGESPPHGEGLDGST